MELVVSWNPVMILLSYAVSFIGSYVVVSLCEQYRLCCTNPHRELKVTLSSNGILVMMAVCLGGVTVWCMHFVGMSAIDLKTTEGNTVSISYDVALTTISVFAVIICAYCGLYIASRDRAFTKTKEQILGMVVNDARHSGVKLTSKFSIIALASLKGIHTLMAGGIVTASGVCIMHYLGMMSQRFDGYMTWQPGVIAASALIAFVVSTVAFWILFRVLALYPYLEWLRVVSALVMGLAVNAMHYTGMYGARYYYEAGRESSMGGSSISSGVAFGAAIVVSSIVSWGLAIVIFRDMRHWHHYCTDVITSTDEIFSRAAQGRMAPVGSFLDKYKQVRGISFEVNPSDHVVAESRGIHPSRDSHEKSTAMATVAGAGAVISMAIGAIVGERRPSNMASQQHNLFANNPGSQNSSQLSSADIVPPRVTRKKSGKMPLRAPQRAVAAQPVLVEMDESSISISVRRDLPTRNAPQLHDDIA